jgi:hypothetical protein
MGCENQKNSWCNRSKTKAVFRVEKSGFENRSSSPPKVDKAGKMAGFGV